MLSKHVETISFSAKSSSKITLSILDYSTSRLVAWGKEETGIFHSTISLAKDIISSINAG